MSEARREDWASYFCRVNDKPASVFLDLSLKAIAPVSGVVNLLIIWLQMNDPRIEDGLSSQQESATLFAIEDRLTQSIVDQYRAIFVGRITNDGRREFYFYAPSANEFKETVTNAMLAFPSYRYEAWSDKDPSWNQYWDVLFPKESNLRWINDSRVIEQLEKHGDQPHLPRKIDHFAYFKSAADCDAFAQLVQSSGFSIERISVPKTDADRYCLAFFKVQAAELNDIFETTSYLDIEARNFNGEYDGWGSPITKSKSSVSSWIRNLIKR